MCVIFPVSRPSYCVIDIRDSARVLIDMPVPWRSRDNTDNGDFHQRLCLRAAVRTFVGLTHVFVTHLSLSQSARARTLPEIAGACVGVSRRTHAI